MQKDYSASNIQILKGLEAVRKRPGMYIGTTGEEGLHHLVYEIVDNSIDEALAGYCDQVDVFIEQGNIIRVEDNGRGIPTDIHPEEGVSALEVVLTKLHAGGKFDKNSYKVSGGLHGVGVSVVNALSEWLEVTVYRNGEIFYQRYKRGIPEKPVAVQGSTERTGTVVRFKPDGEIFKDTQIFKFDILSSRLRELSFLNKGIKINITDFRTPVPKENKFLFEGGVKSFVSFLNENKKPLQSEPIYFESEKETEKGVVKIEVAMEYSESYNELILSFVNNINTREGGTHLSGFKTALTRVFNEKLKTSKVGKRSKLTEPLSGEDTRFGLTAVVSAKVPDPQFEGQTKAKLGNTEIRKITKITETIVYDNLLLYFEQNPDTVEVILSKAVESSMARMAAQRARANVLRKNSLESGSLPGKLADCSEKDPSLCEIYIVEGDSAGGSAKGGRDSKHQAILPLWGKMLNVEKARIEQVVDNDKLKPVIQALGTNVGKHFNLEKLRYDKVIIMADADVDGSHIRTLLLAFFFRYMTQLIETGHIYLAMPPLYKIEYKKKHYYAYDDNEKDRILNEIGISEEENSVKIQRYKGLGEMNPEQLWDTTMNPETRQMMKVTMDDAVEADRIFTVLMGSEVEPRKKFIEENALSVTNLDI